MTGSQVDPHPAMTMREIVSQAVLIADGAVAHRDHWPSTAWRAAFFANLPERVAVVRPTRPVVEAVVAWVLYSDAVDDRAGLIADALLAEFWPGTPEGTDVGGDPGAAGVCGAPGVAGPNGAAGTPEEGNTRVAVSDSQETPTL